MTLIACSLGMEGSQEELAGSQVCAPLRAVTILTAALQLLVSLVLSLPDSMWVSPIGGINSGLLHR